MIRTFGNALAEGLYHDKVSRAVRHFPPEDWMPVKSIRGVSKELTVFGPLPAKLAVVAGKAFLLILQLLGAGMLFLFLLALLGAFTAAAVGVSIYCRQFSILVGWLATIALFFVVSTVLGLFKNGIAR